MSSLLHNGVKSTITRRLDGLCILLNIRPQCFSACHVLTVTVHVSSIGRCELFASLCFLHFCVQRMSPSDSFHHQGNTEKVAVFRRFASLVIVRIRRWSPLRHRLSNVLSADTNVEAWEDARGGRRGILRVAGLTHLTSATEVLW